VIVFNFGRFLVFTQTFIPEIVQGFDASLVLLYVLVCGDSIRLNKIKIRYRGTDAGVISDFFAVERHIQVAADEHLAREEGRRQRQG